MPFYFVSLDLPWLLLSFLNPSFPYVLLSDIPPEEFPNASDLSGIAAFRAGALLAWKVNSSSLYSPESTKLHED